MNIANQVIIDSLRELGYDVKSHSSTIDKQAVGQLISALKKKEESATQDKGAKAVAKPGSAKTSKLPPPPEPVHVKPRVLARYRPEKPIDPALAAAASSLGSTEASAEIPSPSAKAEVTAQLSATAPEERHEPAHVEETHTHPITEESHLPVTESLLPIAHAAIEHITLQEEAHGTEVEFTEGAEVEIKEEPQELIDTRGKFTADAWSDGAKYAPRVIRKLDAPTPKTKKEEEPKKEEPPKVEPVSAEPSSKGGFEKKGNKPGPGKSSEKEDRTTVDDKKGKSADGETVRPMSPSVPIRVAAPSMRATPPRPPKSHRPSPSERHSGKKDDRQKQEKDVPEVPKEVVLTNNLSVQELASKMHLPETEIIKSLFMKGIMRTVNQPVELELAKELASELGYEVLTEERPSLEEEIPEIELSEEDKANLVMRPPVVTIMGHVDHGKTSLLDAIRQTKFLLTDAEAGGITQHIGAYHVEVPDEDGHMRQIVFLDTPGHEAFTAMRARGAKVTDVAILVVAADDGVMPQTIEAIDHAKAAGVPIIVAVNKIDKAGADPERVLTQLMEHSLVAEKYGGDVVTCEVSAKKRIGLDHLLEMILLVSDILDLKADPGKPATGFIVEAELSKGRGPVATALVENGTMREGDFIVAGSKVGRVRALFDDRGQRVKGAGPSMPVEVLGFNEVPQAGERFQVVEDAQKQRELAEAFKGQESKFNHHVSLETLHDMLEKGEVKDLNVIVKADVQGTAEAIADQIRKLTGSEVQVRVLRTASGDISENDVNLAASSNAIIVGFNVQPDANAHKVAEVAGVDIRTYNIIYQITDDLQLAIQGLLKPIREEVAIGQAEVRQVFKVGKGLTIAGCMVINGKVQRNSIARIERDGKQVYEGKLDTLKRFKDDAKEVAQGFECGMSFEKFSDLQLGDKINCFIIHEKKRTEQM
jgi:translation initiation factor IF-2